MAGEVNGQKSRGKKIRAESKKYFGSACLTPKAGKIFQYFFNSPFGLKRCRSEIIFDSNFCPDFYPMTSLYMCMTRAIEYTTQMPPRLNSNFHVWFSNLHQNPFYDGHLKRCMWGRHCAIGMLYTMRCHKAAWSIQFIRSLCVCVCVGHLL